ncbi:MAG: hypothetical protein KC912_13955 [Proteobacteria bacterium]|nr:hypothetical protein [Pseudomonadota bacterium]
MQDELTTAGLDVTIFGVNQAGHESGVVTFTTGRDIGLLQDTAAVNVWTAWGVAYRDVYIVDGDNNVVGVYNLTVSNLAEQTNYDELKGLFTAAATP